MKNVHMRDELNLSKDDKLTKKINKNNENIILSK
jgi:hypothetical protein